MTVKVPLYGSPMRAVQLDERATDGAVFGVNLRWPDGRVVQAADFMTTPGGSSALNTTDDLDEGQWNLWFTPRRAQDAVGSILADSANVALRYVGGTSITADLKPTGITADTYGDTDHIPRITFDANGRATGAVLVPITAGGLDSIITETGDAFASEDLADLLVA